MLCIIADSVFRNIEEILASKGEQVQRSTDDEDTLQVTLEDVEDTVKH